MPHFSVGARRSPVSRADVTAWFESRWKCCNFESRQGSVCRHLKIRVGLPSRDSFTSPTNNPERCNTSWNTSGCSPLRTGQPIEVSLLLMRVQLVDYAFQLFKLLPGFAKFAFRGQA